MKKILAALALGLTLGGCVAYPVSYGVQVEPEYYVGYYNPGYGYWTGYGWDSSFYVYGHPGYGRRYYAPRGWHHDNRGYYHHH